MNFRGGLEIQGTTISNNLADLGGDGFYIGGPGGRSALIQNSIVYGNGTGDQEIMIDDGDVTVRYSDVRNGQDGVRIEDGALNWGAGNIDKDPQFVDAGQGDYHLDDCSAAVNAGDPEYNPKLNEVDLDGEQRLIGTAIDMGVDEVPHDDDNGNGIPAVCECDPCDMDCNGDINAFDIEPFLSCLFP